LSTVLALFVHADVLTILTFANLEQLFLKMRIAVSKTDGYCLGTGVRKIRIIKTNSLFSSPLTLCRH
ncbi:MAG: hypothetical protein AB1861_18645, partial [Cyanobacteriota bacterium]